MLSISYTLGSHFQIAEFVIEDESSVTEAFLLARSA
jgi:hypothetical protein